MSEKEEQIEPVFSGDNALRTPDQDKFGRADFSYRISEIIRKRKEADHLTIGIYGKWGEGKTSVVNFINYYLEKDKDIICLHFNPWRFRNEDELLNSFFKQFSQGISHKLKKDGAKVAKAILTYSGTLIMMAEPLTGLAIVSNAEKIGGWFNSRKESLKEWVGWGKDLKDNTEKVYEYLAQDETLENQKKNINQELRKTGKKHVVFIDDIDRLDNEEIRTLFQLIKLTADFDHVIYVLSFDPDMVAAALDKVYPGKDDQSGMNFLEKIVQVPLELPKVRETDLFNGVLFPGIDRVLKTYSIDINDEQARDIRDGIENGLKRRLATPRMVKRYLNSITFSLPILEGEVNVVDLLLLEGVKICYPGAFDFVFNNKNAFIQNPQEFIFPSKEEMEKQFKETREKFFEESGDESKAILETLFPRIGKYQFSNISEKELSRHQKVNSRYYFERYFTYSIPKSDIPDQKFRELLIGITSNSMEVSVSLARELIESSSGDVFVRKIEENYESITSRDAYDFALLLTELGSYFKKNRSIFTFHSPLRRVADLIKEFILKQEEDERLPLSEKIINECSNIVLVTEVGRNLHPKNNKEQIFSDEVHENLEKLVSSRIKKDAVENGPFYEREETERDTVLLFNIWKIGAPENEVSDYIKSHIGDSTDKAIRFLKSFMASVNSSEHGYLEHGHFEYSEYSYVKKLIDPGIIYNILLKDFKPEMSEPKDVKVINYEGGFEKGLAQKFAFYYLEDKGIDSTEV